MGMLPLELLLAAVLWALQCTLGDICVGGEIQLCLEILGDSCHWHSGALQEMTSPHILSFCYLYTLTRERACWVAFAGKQNLSFVAGPGPSSLAALAQVAACFQSKPAVAAHLQGTLRAGPLLCTTAPRCSRAGLVSPRASPAALLRDKAGLASPRHAQPAQPPRNRRAGLLKGLGVNTTLLFSLSEGPLCWHEFLFSWRSESSFD